MNSALYLRFVKTPGSVTLPKGFRRQYQVFDGDVSPDKVPRVTFNLDQPQLRGTTEIMSGALGNLVLRCDKVVGAGLWHLEAKSGERLAEVSGKGVLSQGWHMSLQGGRSTFDLINPDSLAKQMVTTMLDGETDGLVLMQGEGLFGRLAKRHRTSGGGVFSGLKRFVEGRDWVLEFERSPQDAKAEISFLALALVAIVSLEFSSPD